ncbi:MAG: 1-aminocyclopropane-1-carboxylate deaminase [Saprospiraceae bacterium]|nr:MAG: 1-aminocyclopropane-1-carboxylate deaminase [Saprospiraceae bacterium]
MFSAIEPADLSPLQALDLSLWPLDRSVQVFIKRDDLLFDARAPYFCGNKWRKLKYNLLAARKQGHTTLLTFGGAYSNHILATADAGQLFGFSTIGIVRGEEHVPLNFTLRNAQKRGMFLHYLDRTTYRKKNTTEILQRLEAEFGPCYVIPEGGTNALAMQGCAKLGPEIEGQFGESPKYIALSCGTGGTMAGLLSGLEMEQTKVIGFSALKGDFLQQEVQDLLAENQRQTKASWQINTDYHFGGYAKFKPELIDFIRRFKMVYDIALDPVYTGKLFYGVFDLIGKGSFPNGSRIVVVHSGGLQGIRGFEERRGKMW